MAIIKFVENPPKTKVSLKKTINYIKQPAKTRPDLVGGKDCDWNRTYDDFMEVKEEYDKTDGIMGRHMIMAFDVKDNITPELAKQLAEELLQNKLFNGFQVLYGVHLDKEHIHVHFLINSVNMKTGKRWHQTNTDLYNLISHSNRLCREHGFSEIEFKQDKGHVSDASIHNRFDSWKYELHLAVINAAHRSADRMDFIGFMRDLGYLVDWEDNKKYITFTTPLGKKCRNRKLYPRNKFGKKTLEKEFEDNAKLSSEDELKKMQQQLLDAVKKVDAKYPLSALLESEEELDIDGRSYQNWYRSNRDNLIDDDKYDLYSSLGVSMKYATSMEDFTERLGKHGIKVEFDTEANVSVFTSKQEVEYDNTELYKGDEKYSPSALSEIFARNQSVKDFRKLFWKTLKESKTFTDFQNNIAENGFSCEVNENGDYAFRDKNGNVFAKDIMHKDFSDIFTDKYLIRFLLSQKWAADSIDDFFERLTDAGCSFEPEDENHNKLRYRLDGQECRDKRFNMDELISYFNLKRDRSELRNVIYQTIRYSVSKSDFINKMEQLGYKVEWGDDEKIHYTTPQGNTFSSEDFKSAYLQVEMMRERFAQNEERAAAESFDNNYNIFWNFIRLFRSRDDAPVTSAMSMIGADLTGEKLREFLYHFERGSASRYNRNLYNDFSM